MKLALIIDPYSSGNLYVAPLKSLGYKIIAVHSVANPNKYFLSSYNKEYYNYEIFHNSINTTILAIKKIEQDNNIKSFIVLCGAESGVYLTDLLADILKLKGNNYITSDLRRNKYLMQEKLKKDGITHIKQGLFNNINDIKEWVQNNKLSEFILKPVSSATSENVYWCNNISDIDKYGNYILDSNNLFGNKNSNILVQEKINGTEYVVDCVSAIYLAIKTQTF